MILYDGILVAIELLGAVLLYILAGVATTRISSKWRIFYCIPGIIALFLLTIAGFEIFMSGVYVGICLFFVGFIWDNENLRKRTCMAAFVLGVLTIPICMNYQGYRAIDYEKDFENGMKSMKEHYVLSEHKGINWERLYEKYRPIFQETTKKQDEVANYIAWSCFCAEFQDGHVGFMPKKQEIIEKAYERICGADYGLSLMKLTDGRIVAVNVEKNNSKVKAMFDAAGIHNGTIITAWDGKKIEDVAKKSAVIQVMNFADKDNQEFWLPIYAGGVGGDSVHVAYLNEAGEEHTIELKKIGNYYNRMRTTMEIINQGVDIGHMAWKEVAENAVVLRVKFMAYDSTSSETENYDNMKREIRKKAENYKEKGFTHLILDLRDNSGGSGQMVQALASLFAPEGQHYYCSDGFWDDTAANYLTDEVTGNYISGKDYYFQGEHIWDGPITILVNSNSVSAADHLTKVMQGMAGVTIQGFTESNGSAQGLGVYALESGRITFSNALLLDKDGDIFIDAGVDRESGNDIDVRIPFTQEAVSVLFDEGKDYVLQKCLEKEGCP